MRRFTTSLNGDSVEALKVAQKLLADRGFAVSKIGGGEVRATRSHPFFGKKTNDMIALVSELVIRASSSQISAEVELGTFKKLIVFMVVLIVGLQSLFIIVGYGATQNMTMIWITLATGGPWILIGPAMLIIFRTLALREVEILLNNIAAMAENE